MISQFLFSVSALIFLSLGSMHLYYTFFSEKFRPRNNQVEMDMRGSSPQLTRQTTMWNAWIGFNASHSVGAMFYGLINLILIWDDFDYLRHAYPLLLLDLITLLYYMFLARKYWFRIPLSGIVISTVFFISAILFLFI